MKTVSHEIAQWQELIVQMSSGWIQLRRRLHMQPELSGQEFQTTQILAERMEPLMNVVRPADGTGFWCERIFGTRDLAKSVYANSSVIRWLAIRADIDALPIQTALDTAYASRINGCMHACGHDVHATTLVATIELLDALERDQALTAPIALRAIFQPAEETSQGAKQLIDAGVLTNVECIFALHVDPSLACGQIGVREGSFTASCDVFEVTFQGVGGHSARPHMTNDIPSAVAHWINQLNAQLPRTLNAFQPTVASVCMIECGQSANTLPSQATVKGTLRSTDRSAHESAWQTIHRLGRATAELFGCEVHAQSKRLTPGVVNDKESTNAIRTAAESIVGSNGLYEIPHSSMGAEDFAFYFEKVPGGMFRLGVAGPNVGGRPLHTPQFDVDERAISIGAQVFTAIAINHAQNASRDVT